MNGTATPPPALGARALGVPALGVPALGARGPRFGRWATTALVALAYTVVFAPIAMVVVLSFFRDEIMALPPSGLTLRWYVNAWSQRDFARGFVTSCEIALAATVLGVPVGAAASYALVRARRLPGRRFLNTLLLLPLAVPAIVTGTALYLFFVQMEDVLDMDIKATLGGLVAANVLITVPWTVRLVAASLQNLDRAAEEAAANLGARGWTVFRRVTFPAIRPGVVAAALFAFVASFENLELNLLLVGPGRTTLPVAMLSYLEFRMDPTLAAVATAQIVVVTALLLLTDRFVKLSRVV